MPLERGEEEDEEEEEAGYQVAEEEEEEVLVEEEEESDSAHWIDPGFLGDKFEDSICAICFGVLAELVRKSRISPSQGASRAEAGPDVSPPARQGELVRARCEPHGKNIILDNV